MLELYDSNAFEDELDEKIEKIVDEIVPKKSVYEAEVVRQDVQGTWWVRLPGAESDTPVMSSTVDMKVGDRVTVELEDHVTRVTGNITNPPMSAATSVEYVAQEMQPISGYVKELKAEDITAETIKATEAYIGSLIAEDISADTISATQGYITTLVSGNVTAEELCATHATVSELDALGITAQTLSADHAAIETLEANKIDVDDFTASTAAITGRLDAAESSITSLQANSLTANSAVILSLQAKDAAIDEVLANKATIASLNAATARIGAIEADYLVADDMTAEVGRVNTLLANYATIERLETAEADIDDLAANKANVTDLTAATARIGTIETDYLKAADMTAEVGRVDTLLAGKASVNDLTAATGRITTLESSKADISLLESDYITAANIAANYAEIDFSNVTASWIQNGVIKNGAISNAMINSVSANKLTAGTIDASVIDVTNLNAKNIKVEKINGVSVSDKSIADALEQHESDISDLDDKIDSEVDALNDRIDGAIETFTGTAVPTLSNAPAEDWTDYDIHVGDVYYVVNPNIPQNGYCYRFTFIDDEYSWQLIKDSDVTAALARLQTAEGNIATIQTFDQEIATFKTDTESELSTLMTKTTTLETNVQTAQATANGALVENVQLWYTKANTTAPAKPTGHVESTATTGGAWTTKVPVYDPAYPHYFYCYEYKKANGDYAWSTVVHDEATCESQATARTAQTAANNAQATADKNVKSSIQLWCTKANDTVPTKPTSVVNSTATTGGAWTTKVPVYSTSYPKYFYCWQYELADGTYKWSDVVEDKAMAEVQSTSRTAAANASSALTQVATKVETSVFNETKQTVDENSNAITTLSSVVQSTGAGVLDLFSMDIWESGSTAANAIGKTYAQLKANAGIHARMISTSSIQPGKYTVTQAYHSYWYSFDDAGGMLTYTGWKTESEFTFEVPNGAASYAVIIRRPDNATITDVAAEAAASKLRLKYAYASQSDLSSLTTTVNNVSQTATSNSASITQLNTTVQKNYEMVASRGEQLVTNGSGMLGDNTNFSSWVYDPSVSMNGSSGSFTTNGREKVAHTWVTDEFFPVNIGEQYLLSYDIKCETDDAELPLFYSYVGLYDIDKLAIDYAHVHYPEGTMTTLARDLNNGDTEVYLTNIDSSFVYANNRSGFSFWNYENSTGYAYPIGIYTRYVCHHYYDSQSSIDTVNNKVTLKKAWANGSFSAGTPVSQSLGGANFVYVAAPGIRVPIDETHREGTIGPGLILATTYPESVPYKFREATAYAKIGFLWNYQAKSNAQIWIANVSFAKYVASKAELDTLSSTVTYKFNTVEQTLDGINTSIGSIEDTLEEKADGSTLSSLSAKVNTMSDTVDGHTQTISSVQSTQTTMGNTLKTAIKSSTQLWYSKADTTPPAKPTSHVSSAATTGGAWTTAVPAYSSSYPNYFYCYEWQYTDNSYGWSDVTRDIAMGETQERARTAIENASAAQNTANSAIKSSVQLWFTKANSTAPSAPSSHVTTSNAATGNAWNLVVPTYNASYPHYFYCYQYELADGTYDWSDVVYDAATTENQATSRSAASGVSTLTTRTNQISDTVEGHTSQINHVTKTANASGFGTIDYSAMGIWVQGTTVGETIGKTYEQIKNSSNTTRICFDEPMPITQGVYSVTVANGYQYYTHFFDVDGHLCQMQTWTSTAEGSLTVPQDARSVAFVLRKGTGSESITPDNAEESKFRLTYAYLTEEDVSEFRSDYATFKQTVNTFQSTIGTTYATKTELSGAPPYTELEWVESDGTQFVYTNWKPPIATWGFEADFIIRNAFSSTEAAWRSDTNQSNAGTVFGTRNTYHVNDVTLTSYSANGELEIGSASVATSATFKKDKTRQVIKLHGTTLTHSDGSTSTITRAVETANKPYCNMTVFAFHDGVRRASTGALRYPGTVRIYSLKFFDGDELVMDLVGAKRKSDGMTGLYDKVADHFYPARGLLCGEEVGDLGIVDTVSDAIVKQNVMLTVDNRTVARMWEAEVPTLDRLDDGQQVTVTFTTNVGNSTPDAIVAAGYDDYVGWDETHDKNYKYVYLKLTLSDGSKTEWIPCYYAQGTRLTDHYGSGTPVLMTYREDVHYGETTTSAGTLIMRGWWADPNYDTNTTYTKFSDTVVAGKNGLRYNTLCMKDDEGNWTSIVNQTSAGLSDKTCYTGGLQLGGILWHATNATYAAGANGGQVWESYGGIDFRYSANGISTDGAVTTLQLRKPLYLVGTLDEDDGLYYLDTTKWWTQDTFQEGRVYVQIGTAYNSYYAIFLAANNPSYVWDPTAQKLVEFTYSRIKKAETAIVQTNDLIGFTANSEYSSLKEYADGMIEQEASDRNSAISDAADEISLTVSQNYASKASLDTRVHDEDTFLRRQLPSTVHTGATRIASIKGNTIKWNQLAKEFNATNYPVTNSTRASFAYDNGTAIATPLTTGLQYIAVKSTSQGGSGNPSANHVCFMEADFYTNKPHGARLGNYASQNEIAVTEINKWVHVKTIYRYSNLITEANNNFLYGMNVVEVPESGDEWRMKNPVCIDLTLMFGAGNEPATVAEFEALFPEPYYPYDPGSLLSVNVEGMKAIGFNQYPQDMHHLTTSEAKNLVFDATECAHLLGGYTYRLTFGVSGATSWRVGFIVFDKNGNRYISSTTIRPVDSGLFSMFSPSINYNTNIDGFLIGSDGTVDSYTFTPAVDMYMYLYIAFGNTTANTVSTNTCVHIADNESLNGTYEPYRESLCEIDAASCFPTGLKSAGTAHDELDFENRKAVTRIGAVDLGTLSWTKVGPRYYHQTSVNNPDIQLPVLVSATQIANISCSKYSLVSTRAAIEQVDKAVSIHGDAGVRYITVTDSDYTDAATFKAAMSGVILYYELATPTETDISDALQSTYSVEAGGTEFVLVDEEQAAPQSAPVPFVFEYGLSAMDALADAVVRMSSAESAIVQNADNISMKVSQTDYNGQTVASLINQSPDTVKIAAQHVEIDGTTVFRNSSTSTTTFANYVSGSAQTAVDNLELGGRNYAKTNVDIGTKGTSRGSTCEVTGPSTVTISGTASASAATGNTWFGGLTLDPGDYLLWLTNTNGGTIWFRLGSGPSYAHVYSTQGNFTKDNPYHFTVTTATEYWFGPVWAAGTYSNVETSFMLEKGTKASDWCVANEDLVIEEQYVYISKSSGMGSVNAVTTWVTSSSDQQNAWTTKRPLYDSDYPVLFVAKQRRMANGNVLCTTPVKDDTTTIIDGGHITTGLIDASRINLNTLYVTDLADGDQYARTDILDSMGDQLVVNGNGYLRDNTNFSGFTYDPTQVCKSYGSFRIDGASTSYKYIDRYIPVDTAKRYMTGLSFKNTDSSKQTSIDYTIMCYDNDGKVVYYCYSEHIEESTTTLAQDLVAGDEYVYFTDVSGFSSTVSTGHGRRLLFWNYTDSTGRTWEIGTYTRNVISYNAWSSGSDIDYANNRIKLATAYSGATVPAGTPVSQGTGRDAPISIVGNLRRASSDWQTIREPFGFGYGSERFIPRGTVKIRLRLYTSVASGDTCWLANVWVREQSRTSPYAVCDTEASTTTKDVVCDDYERRVGSTISIKFTNGNSAAYPTIRITSNSVPYASASVKSYTGGDLTEAERTWAAGAILTFMYDEIGYYRLLDGGSTAANASIASTVNSNAVTRSRRIYYRTAAAITNGPATPGTTSSAWDTVSDADTSVFNQWTTKPPRLTQNSDGSGTKYPFLYTCEQRQFVGGTIGYTDVRLDDSTTIIDGGTIVTGQIAANRLDVFDANIQKLKTEYIDADSLEVNLEKVKGTLLVSKVDGLEGMLNNKVDYTGFEDLDNYVRGTRYFLTTDSTAVAGKTYYSRTELDGEYQYHAVENISTGASVSGYYELESLPDSLDSRLNSFGSELDRQSEDLELLGKAVVVDAENATVSIGYINAAGQFVATKTRMSEGGFDVLDNSGNVITHVGEQIDIGRLEGCHITAVGDHMSFMNGDDEVAYIDVDDNGESVFYMTRSVVVKDMFLGENRWKFFKRENNNLSLKWTGV